MATEFATVYNRFLGTITDDMYMELTPQDTLRDLQNLLINALPDFEFPRIDVFDYEINVEEIPVNALADTDFMVSSDEKALTVKVDRSHFNLDLSSEEINIIATLMRINWLQRQVTSIENTRMKYSGSDFKMTSQANHLSKLIALLNDCRKDSQHKQRLYRRRRRAKNGSYESNWSILRTISAIDGTYIPPANDNSQDTNDSNHSCDCLESILTINGGKAHND